MGFLIEGYTRVGGGVFAVGLILALLGMIFTIAPEVIRNETSAMRMSRIAIGMTIVGVLAMVGAMITA